MDKCYDDLVHEYENFTDKELADEFVRVDTYIQMVYNDASNETVDRWSVLSDMIHERFVEKYGTSYMYYFKSDKLI